MSRQVGNREKKELMLKTKIKAYLKTGDRKTAGQLAIQLQENKQELTENREQLKIHEKAYDNNVERDNRTTRSIR